MFFTFTNLDLPSGIQTGNLGLFNDQFPITSFSYESNGRTITMYRIKDFLIDNLLIDNVDYWGSKKTGFQNTQLSFRNPFQTGIVQSENFKQYGLNINNWEGLKTYLKLKFNGKIINYDFDSSLNDNTITLKYSPELAEKHINEFASVVLITSNEFNNEVSSIEAKQLIIYESIPKITSFEIVYKKDESTMENIKAYKQQNTLNVRLQVEDCYNNNQRLVITSQRNKKMLFNGNDSYYFNISSGQLELEITIPEIIFTETEIKLTARIENNTIASDPVQSSNTITLLRHTVPSVSLINASLSKIEGNGDQITLKFNKDWGIDEDYGVNTISIELFENTGNISSSPTNVFFDDSTVTIPVTISNNSWNKQWIRAKIIVKNLYLGIETTKTLNETNTIAVYNITPTIAYRQNHLGINTATPNEQAIITIGGTSGRNKIVYADSSSYCDLDRFRMNGDNCQIENFLFIGGSWDENGPTGGSGSTGASGNNNNSTIPNLATVAYTGEIEDLQQTKTTTIYIYGGRAT